MNQFSKLDGHDANKHMNGEEPGTESKEKAASGGQPITHMPPAALVKTKSEIVDRWEPDTPLKQNEPASDKPLHKDEWLEGGMRCQWLAFYTYIRIPFSVIRVLFTIVTSAASAKNSSTLLFFFTAGLNFLWAILLVMLFIGLHKRKKWGWHLNWIVLPLGILI